MIVGSLPSPSHGRQFLTVPLMFEQLLTSVTAESLSAVWGAGFVLTFALYLVGIPLGAALSLIRKM